LAKVASSVSRGRPMAPPRPGFDFRVERISDPWGKKSLSLCSPQDMAFVGMDQSWGGFSAGRSRCRFLLMKYGGARFYPQSSFFDTRVHFIFIYTILELLHIEAAKQVAYPLEISFLLRTKVTKISLWSNSTLHSEIIWKNSIAKQALVQISCFKMFDALSALL